MPCSSQVASTIGFMFEPGLEAAAAVVALVDVVVDRRLRGDGRVQAVDAVLGHGEDLPGAGLDDAHRRPGAVGLGDLAADGLPGAGLELAVDGGLDAEPAAQQQVLALLRGLAVGGVAEDELTAT